MDTEARYHPSELAYLLSYESASTVIGWGTGPFALPKGGEAAFYKDAVDRLTKAKRLLPGKQPGRYRFSDEAERISSTLSDPLIVMVTNRKEGDGVRILTHHVKGEDIVELSLRKDGHFDAVGYETLGGPAGAAAAFAGASRQPVAKPLRFEATRKVFNEIRSLAKKGQEGPAVAMFRQLGASEADAKSAVAAFRAPKASGVISVLYCANNTAQDCETYAVLTNDAGQSWVVFPPASIDGPVVIETTSVGSLAARILVAVAARMALPM